MIYDIIRKMTDAAHSYNLECWTWVDDNRTHPMLRVKLVESDFRIHKDYAINISESALGMLDLEDTVNVIMTDAVKKLIPNLITN